VWGRARAAADRALEENLATFERIGARVVARPAPNDAQLVLDRSTPFSVRMRGRGRVFGGAYALEVATTQPVLPRTSGLNARGRGLVRLRRVTFRGRRGDEAGTALARHLEAADELQAALGEVHFERIRVEPEGRPVIRHMGGSVVWVLFPPLVRPVPFPPAQVEAVAAALEAFARAAR
jgi:hypothetical protein